MQQVNGYTLPSTDFRLAPKLWLLVTSLLFFGCKALPPATSSLAVSESNELGFSTKTCSSPNAGTARLSKIKTSGFELVLFNPNYCNALKRISKSRNNGGFSLADQAPGRKPVMVVYGYAGNAPSDRVEHQGVNDMMPWVNSNFRPVVIPAGASISDAQRQVIQDRTQNPQDYGKDSWVGTIIASHGYTDPQTGIHRLPKSDVLDAPVAANQVGPTFQTSSYRTTDVQKALLEGVGNQAGTVYCMTWACQSGAAQLDPQFESLKTSAINPDQKRVFQFSSAPDKLADFSSTVTPSGIVETTPAEKSLVFASQSVDPARGLTVAELNSKFQSANLGASGGYDITTVFSPNNGAGVSDVGSPLGTPAYDNATMFYSPQGPTVVGAADAYVFPPGIGMNTSIPKIATGSDIMQDSVKNLPPNTFPAGEVQIAPPEYSPNSPGFQPSYSGGQSVQSPEQAPAPSL